MQVRAARDEDVPLLQAIEVAAGALFRDVGLPEIADASPPSPDELRSAAAVLVAVVDGAPVGYARIELLDGHAHLEQLSVHPDHGRRGAGTALLDAVADWARARGDRELTLTTFRDVAFNAPLYARRGYEVVSDDERGPELVEQMRIEAEHGLEPSSRVAMRRPL